MKKLFFVFLSAVFALLPLSAAEKPEKNDSEDDFYSELNNFLAVLMLARKQYVDKDKVTYKNLFRGASNGMLKSLDRFSAFEEPEKFKRTMEHSRGAFCGIGATIMDRNGHITIVSPIPGSPAAKAGIKPGDRIMMINSKKTAGLNLSEVVAILKGPIGTTVVLDIYRPADDSKHKITIKRDKIKVSSIKNAGRFDGIGYFRLTGFTQETAADIQNYLQRQKNLQGLIIDLRNNPGGLLKSAVETCSLFIPEGKKIVSVERRAGSSVVWKAVKCKKYLDIPIVLLINSNSASASEIVASCLKDYKRAVLVGEKTFGKGSVQTLIPLAAGGGVRITVAKYYTPSRRPIHGVGVEPDIKVELSPARTAAVIMHQMLRDQLLPFPKKGKYQDDQLIRAIEILKGICIFKKQ